MLWLLVCLLALPFHPFWPDFEATRRAMAMVGIGVLAILSGRSTLTRIGIPGVLALALAGCHLLRSIGVENPLDGVARGGYLLGLAVVLLYARRNTPEQWLQATLPATALVAGYGLLQSLGVNRSLQVLLLGDARPDTWSEPLWWAHALLHHGGPDAPVSTLGNLNAASELVAVGAAAATVLIARGSGNRSALPTLVLGTAYLLVNGSRSGLLALPLALIAVLSARGVGRRLRLRVVAAVLGGLGVGLLSHLARPDGAPPRPDDGVRSTQVARPSTIEVRLEIWRACLPMVAERPLLGHGSAQFKVHYPRFRSAREIDLSTTGESGPRSFPAAPRNPHNDHLHILTETGVIGLALWLGLAGLVLVAAARVGRIEIAPLLAFATLTLVRAPLGNAPVAVLVFGYAGALLGGRQQGRALPAARELTPASMPFRLAGWGAALAGVVLVGVGACLFVSQTAYAAFLREHPDSWFRRGTDRTAALTRAASWDPANADVRALRLQMLRAANTAADDPLLRSDAEALATLTPYDTFYLQLRAEVARAAGDVERAVGLLGEILALDAQHIDATLHLAAIHFDRIAGQPDETAAVVATLYRDPHPQLRARLSAVLDDLRENAAKRAGELEDVGRGRAAERYRLAALVLATEVAFLQAVDALRTEPDTPQTLLEVGAMATLFEGARLEDIRPLLLGALALHHNQPDADDRVRQLGAAAAAKGLRLTAPHRRMLAGVEAPLRDHPAWRAALTR